MERSVFVCKRSYPETVIHTMIHTRARATINRTRTYKITFDYIVTYAAVLRLFLVHQNGSFNSTLD